MNVSKTTRIIIAGVVWAAVGAHLTHLAVRWLLPMTGTVKYFCFGIGTAVSFLIYGFGLRKIVDRNIRRITTGPDKAFVLTFIPVRSYVFIFLMVLLGIFLRHSGIPVLYRAVFYFSMGIALLISFFIYARVAFTRISGYTGSE